MESDGIIDRWLKKHQLLYIGATRHPFVASIRDGSIDFSSYKRWLAQDHVFVMKFIPFAASVLIKASRVSNDCSNDLELILSGLSGLNSELLWFKDEALRWEVVISNTVAHEINQKYCTFLESLMAEVEYPIALTALWTIETVYQESFAYCLEDGNNTPPQLLAACSRWGNQQFGEYCSSLRQIASRSLEKAPIAVIQKAESAFLSVLEHEIEFWNLSNEIIV